MLNMNGKSRCQRIVVILFFLLNLPYPHIQRVPNGIKTNDEKSRTICTKSCNIIDAARLRTWMLCGWNTHTDTLHMRRIQMPLCGSSSECVACGWWERRSRPPTFCVPQSLNRKLCMCVCLLIICANIATRVNYTGTHPHTHAHTHVCVSVFVRDGVTNAHQAWTLHRRI